MRCLGEDRLGKALDLALIFFFFLKCHRKLCSFSRPSITEHYKLEAFTEMFSYSSRDSKSRIRALSRLILSRGSEGGSVPGLSLPAFDSQHA